MNEKSNGWFNNLSEAQRAEIKRASATYPSSRRAIYKKGKVSPTLSSACLEKLTNLQLRI